MRVRKDSNSYYLKDVMAVLVATDASAKRTWYPNDELPQWVHVGRFWLRFA